MVHPDLARTERALGGEVLLGHDVLAIRAPAWLVEQAEALIGELAPVAAVAVHDPDIVAAAAVGGEGDPPTIGGEARLGFVRQAFGDPRRRAPADRHCVDVAQQVEDQGPPVGADIQVHPGAFLDRNRHLAHLHSRRCGDVPFGRILGVLGLRGGGQGRGEAKRQGHPRGGAGKSLHQESPSVARDCRSRARTVNQRIREHPRRQARLISIAQSQTRLSTVRPDRRRGAPANPPASWPTARLARP